MLLGAALTVQAQKFIPKTIQFIGDQEYSTDELLAASGLKKGETLTYADLNDTSKRLMDTGMFASPTFKFGGQDLTFRRVGAAVVESAAIAVPYRANIEEGQVYKTGAIRVPENTPITQAEITKILTPTTNGPVTGARVRSVWETIASRYHAKGYLDCEVTPVPQFDDLNLRVNYDVAVDPGPVCLHDTHTITDSMSAFSVPQLLKLC